MNRHDETTAHDNNAERIARTVRLCAFVLPLILAAMLLGVRSAQATPPLVASSSFYEEEFGLEEEEEEEEEGEGPQELEGGGEFIEAECEAAEEEFEEGLLTETDVEKLCIPLVDPGRAGSSAAPCPLRSARAHASTRRGRLKLTIGYTTNAPVGAAIQVRKVGTFKRHLNRSGVIRFRKKLKKKRRPKRIAIRIRVPSASGRRCGLVQVVANKAV